MSLTSLQESLDTFPLWWTHLPFFACRPFAKSSLFSFHTLPLKWLNSVEKNNITTCNVVIQHLELLVDT